LVASIEACFRGCLRFIRRLLLVGRVAEKLKPHRWTVLRERMMVRVLISPGD
jgi:hypothetical protein